jgi:Family of unknown function (DUF6533)
MFLWDYIITLGMEVELVWKSKWNFMKGLYLFQRYLPFAELVWVILSCQSDMVFIFACSIFFDRAYGGNFEGDRVSKGILRWWRFVKLTRPTFTQGRRNLFSVQYWRSLVLVHPRASLMHTTCFEPHWLVSNVTVILTFRTWAVWNGNQRLSIILPILYSLWWGSSLIIMVKPIHSNTCRWNFHAHSWLYGWFISW